MNARLNLDPTAWRRDPALTAMQLPRVTWGEWIARMVRR
jgi:hypothetical protein